MKTFLLLAISFIFIKPSFSQKEDIHLVLLETISTEVYKKDVLSNGKNLPLYYAPDFGPDGGTIGIDTLTTENRFGTLYPAIARIRIFSKGGMFPDNASLRIDIGCIINGKYSFPNSIFWAGVSNEKIVSVDDNNKNKYFLDRGNQKNYDEFYLYTNSVADNYQFKYIKQDDSPILRSTFILKECTPTIKNGVRLKVK